MKTLVALCLLCRLAPLAAGESDAARIEGLLAAAAPPDGVVFEIMAWRDHSWDWAAPLLHGYVERLRQRFPELDIALVSHGAELFELALGNAERPALRQLAELSAGGMALHVAGDYAQWKRLGQNDFPGYVDVAPSAAALLADYTRLGYVRIRLESPHGPD